MRHNYKYILGAFAVVLSFASCQKEEFEPFSESNQIKLYAASSTIRTDIETKGSESGTAGVINSDTQVTVPLALVRLDQNKDTHYPGFLLTEQPLTGTLGLPDETSAKMREVTFTNAQFFRNPTNKIKFASWGPWKKGESGFSYTSDAAASVATMPIDGETDYIYGSVTTGSKSEAFNTIQYSHALCQYNIYVYAMIGHKEELDENGNKLYYTDATKTEKTTTETDFPCYIEYDTSKEWGAFQELKITKMPTSCEITLPKDESGVYSVKHTGNTAVHDFGANNNYYFKPTKLPAGFENMVKVATCVAGSPTSGMLTLSITTENSKGEKEVSIARNFKPGNAYDIYLRFSDHGFVNSSVQVTEWNDFGTEIVHTQSVDMYYNLSRYETANCYTIASGNYNYCFDGTKRGNGSDNVTINPGYIDIAWMDFDNTFQDKNKNTVTDSEGKVIPFLSLSSHNLSNGLVLLRVGPDETNLSHSLWGKKGNAVIAAYDKEGGNVIWTWHLWFTDRIYTYGVGNGYVMQDRNLGASSAGGTSASKGLYYQWGRPTPLNMNTDLGYKTSTDRVTSPEKAQAYVNTFIGVGNNDWLTTGNDGLWGFVNERTNIEKTVYDPCPYGYYLPDKNVWEDIASTDNLKSFSIDDGVKLEINGNTMYIPVLGYYDHNGNLTNNSGTNAAAYLWSGYIGTSTFYYFHDQTHGGSANETSVRTSAMQLRCMAEAKEELITKDLSAAQTANSYIISKDGFYKFDATVRGNGVGSLVPLGTTGVTWDIAGGVSTKINPDHARILWWQGGFENYSKWGANNFNGEKTTDQLKAVGLCLEVLDDGKLTDGYINLRVKDFAKGNVIIAACDIADNILWTWQIWLTDKPADIDNGYYALMDRFLGATYAPDLSKSLSFTTANNGDNTLWATFGLFYQWGRKDPFCGAAVGSTTSNTLDSSPWWYYNPKTSKWTKKTAIETSNGTQEGTIALTCANPTTFYKGTAANGQTSEWVVSMSSAGDEIMNSLWGYAVSGNAYGRSFVKTMHDPCPPGYRTMLHSAGYLSPVNGDYYGTHSYYNGETNNTNSRGIITNQNEAATPTTDTTTKNGNTTTTTKNPAEQGYYGKAWYPFAGYRQYNGTTNEVLSNARINTFMPKGTYNTRTTYMSSTAHGQGNGSFGTSTAMSVRCQKE